MYLKWTNKNEYVRKIMQTIVVENLVQGYGKKTIIKDINLTLQKSEIVALIGPSGAGKTTLISTIMGMIAPKFGNVKVLGQSMPNRLLLQKIGFMAQTDALYQDLTGLENLEFFGKLQGLNKQKLTEQIQKSAKVVDLTDYLKMPVQDYSGGMKRRLSLAISLLSEPRILILDEPTVGIDPELRLQIWKELHRLANLGTTILLTTHVMEDADEADSLLMIRNGEAIAQGTPQELLAKYGLDNIEQVFLQAGRDQDEKLGSR